MNAMDSEGELEPFRDDYSVVKMQIFFGEVRDRVICGALRSQTFFYEIIQIVQFVYFRKSDIIGEAFKR